MTKVQTITLQHIADQLEISKVTVSKALRNHPDISEDTKLRVADLARDLGYVPNFIARNLSAGQSRTIGVVVPKIAHHFFASAIEAMYQTAYDNNYEIILTVSQENAENEARHIQTLQSMRVDGLLVSVTEKTTNFELFRKIKARQLPIVFFDRAIEGVGISSVTTDDRQGARIATEHLISSGYTRIAHFAGYQYTNIGRDRCNAFVKTMNNHGIAVDPDWLVEGGFGEDDGYRGFQKLVRMNKLPDVIFAVTYPVALGIFGAAAEHGIDIPGDIDIICFGGSNYQRFFTPLISYVKQPAFELGVRAIQQLIHEIKEPEKAEVAKISLPTELYIREGSR